MSLRNKRKSALELWRQFSSQEMFDELLTEEASELFEALNSANEADARELDAAWKAASVPVRGMVELAEVISDLRSRRDEYMSALATERLNRSVAPSLAEDASAPLEPGAGSRAFTTEHLEAGFSGTRTNSAPERATFSVSTGCMYLSVVLRTERRPLERRPG